MIRNIGKITIYVKNQQEAKDFWINKAGFVVKEERPMGPTMTWLEVGPSKESFTTFVIYEKDLMASQNPNANLGHPSIILSTDDIEATHASLKENGVEVRDIMAMPYGKMFTFHDQDGNAFMVRED